MTVTTQILKLAKTLFVEAEWPCIETYLQNHIPNLSRTLFIEDELAAFVIVNAVKSGESQYAFISYCGVSPTHQGKGYGSKLLKETLTSIFQADFTATRLYVDKWNNDARRLYERLGFKQIGSAIVAGSDCWLYELKHCEDSARPFRYPTVHVSVCA
jgi:ribosomal protein S18 acetylase RimI-like enzyme